MSRYFNSGTLHEKREQKPPSKLQSFWSNFKGEWDGVMPDAPVSDADMKAGGKVELYDGKGNFLGVKQVMDTPRGCYLVEGRLFTGDGNESGCASKGHDYTIKPTGNNGRG
jgi:hypothetical protein